MIKKRSDIKDYLAADIPEMVSWKARLRSMFLHNEFLYIYKYLKCLRTLEYWTNNRQKTIVHRLIWLYYVRKHKVLSWRYKFTVHVNTCDKGLHMFHCGPIKLGQQSKIGKNFTCRTGCIIATTVGNKKISVEIGDNVTFGLGVIVLCKKIGRGAMVNAGSVLTNNVPPYAIVFGNPAKVVGFTRSLNDIIEFEKNNYPESERLSFEELEDNYNKYFLNRIKEIKNFVK